MSIFALGGRRRESPAAIPTETPWESTGTLTSVSEEATYLSNLATQRTISLHTLATSAGGRTVHALRIGSGAGRPAVLLTGAHSGVETASREAALIVAREVAASTDPDVAAFLAERALWIVSTLNPDGRVLNSRYNANGIDLNRDALQVTQPETRGLAQLFRDHSPIAYIDGHENIPGDGFASVEYESAMGGCVPPSTHAYGITAAQRSYIPDLTAAGVGNAWYTSVYYHPQIAHLALGLTGCPTALVETTSVAATFEARVDRQLLAMRAWFADVVEYAADYEAAADTGRAWAAANTSWDVTGHRGNPRFSAAPGTTVIASGYTLTSVQYATAQQALNAHGVDAAVGASTVSVSLNQPRAAVAVQLLDPASPARIVSGATRT